VLRRGDSLTASKSPRTTLSCASTLDASTVDATAYSRSLQWHYGRGQASTHVCRSSAMRCCQSLKRLRVEIFYSLLKRETAAGRYGRRHFHLSASIREQGGLRWMSQCHKFLEKPLPFLKLCSSWYSLFSLNWTLCDHPALDDRYLFGRFQAPNGYADPLLALAGR
jgi:hypothetical protein